MPSARVFCIDGALVLLLFTGVTAVLTVGVVRDILFAF